MTERPRLTDEQLRAYKARVAAADKMGGINPIPRYELHQIIDTALALRAERAKPTQGDVDLDILLDAIASVRDEYSRLCTESLTQMELFAAQGDAAETSQYSTEAERHGASLLSASRILSIAEDFAKSSRAAFSSIRAEGSAERAKLAGELGYARTWIAASVRHHQRDSILARLDRALDHPAESGATERIGEYVPKEEACPNCNYANPQIPRCMGNCDRAGAKP